MSQRVTERNARDVAKKAEAASRSGSRRQDHRRRRAHGARDRHLNNEKLADAYEPPQVEALAALVEARSRSTRPWPKAQEQLKQQQKETIQAGVCEAAGRSEEDRQGHRHRLTHAPKKTATCRDPTAIRLGQLPGEQGGVADRADKLGEQLEQLDSVVFVWANKDIVKTMNAR